MRPAALTLTIVLVTLGACTRHRAAADPRAERLRIATAADTAFVRRTCFDPDSVLAGTKPCYAREQRPHIKVF